MAAAVTISLLEINIRYIITFNGTAFGLVYCYLIPFLFHLKCAYLHRPAIPELTEEEEPTPSSFQMHQTPHQDLDHFSDPEPVPSFTVPEHQCHFKRPGVGWQVADVGLMALMMGIALYVIGFEFKELLL
jgi:hypothetical protein